MPDPLTQRLLPWLVAVGFFMQTLDTTILNTALPAMAYSLHEPPLRMQSVVVAYMLTVALLIPASGWLADRFGTRCVFMAAIVLFSLGSLLCALSATLQQLVAARVVQGVGGALLLPVGRLAILRAFPKHQLLQVLSFVTVPGLIGPLIGPALGGWLVEVASWHWVFLVNLPVGIIGGFATWRFMPALVGERARFDWPGFILFGAGMVLVSLALQGLGEHALPLASSLVLLFAGLAAMAGYWLHAARSPAPLFHRDLFRIQTYAIGALGNLFARLGSGAMPFMTPLFLQVGLGFSPSRAGLFMVPTVLGAMLAKVLVGVVIPRWGYRHVLVGNTLLLGLSIASFALSGPYTPDGLLLLQLAVFGVVNSVQFSAMNTLALGDLGPDTASSGNSLLSVVMQLSMSLGVAAAAALLAGFSRQGIAPNPQHVVTAFQSTYACVGLLSMLAAFIFLQLRQADGDRHPVPLDATDT
ncbi:multidrug transporter subunit MdtD [Chitiniphilus purpureus]|uniref:Multidrug transporter subunit MdtD n=1 Tax=Chitiniphilus purpureus TaxID=2981137 RepID=A0ABY6DS64_9NEIS|nr:multidrug transporter subunit MdtD [Chitiniphilus sp. CD1]UXY17073.1 multidrug transporter subunit MdtD [Chitiniphilus sp. CD1]